jgi:hypothetical protein
MRNSILALVFAWVAHCAGRDAESIRPLLKVGSDAKGLFIATNSTSSVFYVISTNLNLSSLVGSKIDTNLISDSRMELITQYVPSMKFVEGRLAPGEGWLYLSGRYALLDRNILTLTDFDIRVSNDPLRRDEILSVHAEFVTLAIPATILQEMEKMKRENR